MVITGIVVAFAASALAIGLLLRLAATGGRSTLEPADDQSKSGGEGGAR